MRRLVVASSLVTALAWGSGELWAQEPLPATSPTRSLEDVVVSARKRDESLATVPVSVTVIDAQDLEVMHAQSLADLTSSAPNVAFHTVGEFGHSSSLDIRGVGGGGANVDTDPAVAIYVDGQYQTANTIDLESLVGIESIDVLRGPQGTLFGRNAFAGAINVTTKNPSGDFDAESALTLGNFGRRNLTAAVDLPVTGTVSARIDLGWINSSGFYTNPLDGGRPLGGDANLTIRPTVVFTPMPALTVQFKYGFVDDQSGPTPNKYALDPPAGLFGILNPSQYADWGRTQLNPAGSGGPFSTGFTNLCKCNQIKIDAPSLKLDYDAGVGRLTAISGYQQVKGSIQSDATGTAVPLLLNDLPYTINVLTQEVRWLTRAGERFQFITGLYALHDDLTESDLGYIVLGGPAAITWKDSVQKRTSTAAFAEAEWTLAPNVRLTAGARYTEETKRFWYGASVPVGLEQGAAVLTVPYPYVPLKADWHNLAPKLSLDYQWTLDTMIYASWSRGFKAGGFQGLASTAADAGPYGDETMEATEVGVKSYLWQRRARLSADVFYENIQGLQRAVVLLGDGITNNLTVNAANAISTGIEMEAAVLPTEALTLKANAGYLDAHYTRFCADFVATNANRPACGSQPGEVDNTNLVPSNAPRFTLSLGADYALPLRGGSVLDVHVDEAYTSSLWTADDNDPLSYRVPAALLNASLRVRAAGDRYSVSVWGRNLTDKIVTEDAVMAYPLFTIWNPTAPRTFGVSVETRLQGNP